MRSVKRAVAAEITDHSVHGEADDFHEVALSAARWRIRSAVDRASVIDAIREIAVNLLGIVELAVLEAVGQRLHVVASFEMDERYAAAIAAEDFRVQQAVRSGIPYICEPDPRVRTAGRGRLSAAVPLEVGDVVTGAIACFRLVAHKDGFDVHDREIFTLLSVEGGEALHRTRPGPG